MDCFWTDNGFFEAFCVCMGLPSLVAMAYCVLSSFGIRQVLPTVKEQTPAKESLKSAYGVLLDVSDVAVDVDKKIEAWVFRAAVASLFYAFMLFALAVTTVLHIAAVEVTFVVDGLEAFLMFLCKLAVGVCAHHVHRRMSRLSRTVAGRWILVLALSMDAMALVTLGIMFAALGAEMESSKWQSNFCLAEFLFLGSLVLSLPFQSLAAFALFRIQERAQVFVADKQVFSRVVGNHWQVLVMGTFGLGVGLWLVGALLAFHRRHSMDPLLWMTLSYVVAAGSQGLSGMAMLSINKAVRRHFQTPQGKLTLAAVAEMAGCADQGDVIELYSGNEIFTIGTSY